MKLNDLRLLTAASMTVLLMAGCIPEENDDTTDDDNSNSTGGFCNTETYTTTITPEVTLTEVTETSADNETAANAQVININSSITGYLSQTGGADWDDYYKMTVSEGQEINLRLSNDPGQNNLIFLYNGTTLVAQDDTGDYVKKINYTVPAGMTEMTIHLTAYDGAGNYALTVQTPAEPVEVTNTQTLDCYGDMTGYVSDAISDARMDNTTLYLREGHDVKTGTIAATAATGATGIYEFTNIEAGEYTAEVVRGSYSTTYKNIVIEGKSTVTQNFAIAPSLPTGQMRIVLSWSDTPDDLDSHLTVPDGSGGSDHLYYRNKSTNGASLDRDDSTGYGPETITITTVNSGTYTYYVRAFGESSSFNFSTSEAIVSVYDDTGLIGQFEPPTGAGVQWNVFTYNGQLTTTNTIAD